MLSKQAVVRLVFTVMFITLAVLTYVLCFTEVNNINDFLFAYSYYIISIFIFHYMIKVLDSKGTILFWLVQMMLFFTAVLLEYYLLTKILILIAIILGVKENYNQIKKHMKQNKKIKYLSLHDELTGLYNRRHFENIIKKFEGMEVLRPLSIIIGDINDFKKVNDSLGHVKGDEYIKKSAKLFQTVLRKGDIIARIGGDEFAVVLLNTDYSECQKVVEKIREASSSLKIDIALGYATTSEYDSDHNGADSLEDTMKHADSMMYINKRKMKDKSDAV